eukprot:3557189-Alexandrium_andersonii.AAC.1
MRVTQGHSIPWSMLGRLGRPLGAPEARASLGGYIYHLTRTTSLEGILRIRTRAPQDSADWRECARPSRKFIHFLPFHPDDPRLATTSRLDKAEYDAVLQVDFRYCQFLGNADFVATQN